MHELIFSNYDPASYPSEPTPAIGCEPSIPDRTLRANAEMLHRCLLPFASSAVAEEHNTVLLDASLPKRQSVTELGLAECDARVLAICRQEIRLGADAANEVPYLQSRRRLHSNDLAIG